MIKKLVDVVPCSCVCGGSEAYQINLDYGSFYIYGCVCHHPKPSLLDVAEYLVEFNIGENVDPATLVYLDEGTTE